MKNKFAIVIVVLMMLAVVLGCDFSFGTNSSGSSSSEKPKTNAPAAQGGNSNTADTAKTGVKECDEFLDMIAEESKSPDENFVTRKIRETAVEYAKEQVKQSIEENKGDKEKIAVGCREAREQYVKDKANKEAK